jgi:hypothetical protein
MRQTLKSPSFRQAIAIRAPSGDHDPSSFQFPATVIRRAPVPSGSTA